MKIIKDTTEFYIEEPTAVAIGKFDGFHCGHQKLLGKMRPLPATASQGKSPVPP